MVATTSKEQLLTEAEILAMPEDDYMNPAQLAFFRDRLARMRDELLENAASTGANLRENELVADPADRATVEEEHALELRVRDRERKLIKKIEEALGRIVAQPDRVVETPGCLCEVVQRQPAVKLRKLIGKAAFFFLMQSML